VRHTAAIHFGAMSLILAFGVLQGFIVLVLLLRTRSNREANRILASLLAVGVLRLLPYVAGYAGVYDAYPWLSFAPWNLSFAFGPLIYLFVVRLTAPKLPRRWWWHLILPAPQFAYYAVLFLQPTNFKNHWDKAVQRPWVAGPQYWLTILSAGVYLALAFGRLQRYQRWLQDDVSFAEDVRMPWLQHFIIASGTTMLVWLGFGVADLFHPLNYFAEFPLYLGFTAFVYYLALEGWRHAGDIYPHPAPVWQAAPTLNVADGAPAAPLDSERWKMQGTAWLEEIRKRELWRNADLSAGVLARELGTNTTYLSKALNEGLGQSFSECINRLRVEALEQVLRSGPAEGDLLALALAAGFRSKASFNRAFKTYTGQTPSQYRSNAIMATSQIVNS
jgi:AraC-like DNA-binding protein